ncbi:phage integrase N-terminal SAM-like domain-containing protein [Moritella viscosa]|nr:Integron integrase [Moritella viscosa]SHO11605.1 Integron integrase [Moritella viscosa]SHO18041.1 Integron integrase [Moritella viscosa]
MTASPFLESIRTEIKTKHYSYKTEKVYIYWVKQFIIFNNKRHPETMGNTEIEGFLNYLAVKRKVSASTQNIALCAIIFMYRHVLKQDIKDLKYDFTKKPKRLPTVLFPSEVEKILKHMSGQYYLITALLYGGGFRLNEALSLRIKDIDLINKSIFIFKGKGNKDRYTLLPESLIPMINNRWNTQKLFMKRIYLTVLEVRLYQHHCIENISHHYIHILGNIYSLQPQGVSTHTIIMSAVITFMIQPIQKN